MNDESKKMELGTDGSNSTKSNGESKNGHGGENFKLELMAKVKKLYSQMMKGCDKEFCTNEGCCATCIFSPKYDAPPEIFKVALDKFQKGEKIIFCCESPKPPPSIQAEQLTALAGHLGIIKHATYLPDPAKAQQLTEALCKAFANAEALTISFRSSPKISLRFLKDDPELDYEALDMLIKICKNNDNIQKGIVKAIEELIKNSFKNSIEGSNLLETLCHIRKLMILLEIPGLYETGNFFILRDVLYKALSIRDPGIKKHYLRWMDEYPAARFRVMVQSLQTTVTLIILARKPDNDLERICNMLNLLYESNKSLRKVKYEEFYNEIANKNIEFRNSQIRKWYRNRQSTKFPPQFTICDYAWMLDPGSKSLMLSIESDIAQEEEYKVNLPRDPLMAILGGHPGLASRFCVIEVNRANLIEDSLNILSQNHVNFKKELKVKFTGEQGVDQGGVKKEFFQLVVRQIFDPAYGMFNYNTERRVYWFNQFSYEPNIKFELIGFVIGLALYNSVILDLHFPRVVYKKLLGLELSFEDLVDYSPATAQTLKLLLDYDKPDLEDVLCFQFAIDVEQYGAVSSVPLKPGGEAIPVTQQNKKEYVELYLNWLFNTSIEKQFTSFKKGFSKLYAGEFMQNCEPEELELLICGSPGLDFKNLEEVTKYDNGYTKDHPAIK